MVPDLLLVVLATSTSEGTGARLAAGVAGVSIEEGIKGRVRGRSSADVPGSSRRKV